jgi:2'-hydroxyisoflavone reductase
VSVYQDPQGPGYTEDAPLIELDDPSVDQVTEQTYGGLKVLCERQAVTSFGSGSVLVRPTYVVGPDDYTWRFPYWVGRMARGGEVLVPGPGDDPSQVIDARDMGRWIVELLERGEQGPFHAASPRPPWTWAETMQLIADTVAPAGTTLTWVDADFLREHRADHTELPLWPGGDSDRFMLAADPSAAYATGLAPRPLEETVRDTLEWVRSQGDVEPPVGLRPERETELLRLWRDRDR